MRRFFNLLYLFFCFTMFISCDENEIKQCTADSIVSEYIEKNNEDFVSNYKNTKILLNGVIGFYSKDKESASNEYYVIFDNDTIDYVFLSGTYVSCTLLSQNKLEVGKRLKVICQFDDIYKDLSTDNIGFKNGKIVY